MTCGGRDQRDRAVVITIDGPAGAGKSTVAKVLARHLAFLYIDSGALYRTVTWLMQREGVNTASGVPHDIEAKVLSMLLDSARFTLRNDPEGATRLYVDGEDITAAVRSSLVERLVPVIAQRHEVRDSVTALQRQIAGVRNVVVDGRDAGTVVFPDAALKFFLTASSRARAQRRYLELRRNNVRKTLPECLEEIETRDSLDRNRGIAPLTPAAEAIVIDTSDLTLRDVVAVMIGHIRTALGSLSIDTPTLGDTDVQLIAVGGLLGVGKSSLCAWLSEKLAIPVFAENPEANPYLPSYYEDRVRWALHSQMWFLYRKFELLSSIGDQRAPAIIDRTLHEDYMFARLVLEGADLELYENWYRIAFALVPQPNVIVSLEASIDTIEARIRSRGRPYEQRIARDFLVRLDEDYRTWVAEYAEAPVIRVDTDRMDLEDPVIRAEVFEDVRGALARRHVAVG